MKTKLVLCMGILIVSSISIFLSCKKQTTNEKLNGIYIVPLAGSSATENKTLLSFVTIPYKFPIAAAISTALTSNVEVTLAVDNGMVATFNAAQNTRYAVMPAGSYSLETTNVTIPTGAIASNQTNVVVKANMLTTDVAYLLPVKVASTSANNITLNSAIATKYYIVRAPTPVIGNLSTGKAASMSKGNQANAGRGNDGITGGNLGAGQGVETGAGNEEFWQVDLGAISPRIDQIDIWNRTDCCNLRTAKFYVFISDVPFTGVSVASSLAQPGVYKYYQDAPAGLPSIILPAVSGRYIRLQNTTTESLTLAELTATGIKP
ncbi:DUF1735 domain-containing protein [Pedobacter sp. PLR]|uniref:BT_3987 domain-containing protein n=1 Tax=Pedobacter sp. PLR TaxID=2994465 RepID=UPI00224543DC|nr:DUF1735 domain-containing protein [Pedobacter sp. PLR]MCX2454317.1 DUF1735 domain-containing protein [Pedobacter sp. PLR]